MLPSFAAPSGSPGGATQDRANIDFLLNPNFNTFETDMNAAERAVAGGVAGSQWAGNVRSNMLDSERIRRMQLGNQMLEPYLNREFQAGQSAADRASRAQLAQAEANAAMERLRLSEAGETARLTQSERARLEQIIEQGNQSMRELLTSEAGASARQRESIRGQLANTLLSNSTRPGLPVFANTPTDNWANHPNMLGVPSTIGSATGTRARLAGGGVVGVGSSGIDRILQQYGLLN